MHMDQQHHDSDMEKRDRDSHDEQEEQMRSEDTRQPSSESNGRDTQ